MLPPKMKYTYMLYDKYAVLDTETPIFNSGHYCSKRFPVKKCVRKTSGRKVCWQKIASFGSYNFIKLSNQHACIAIMPQNLILVY